MCNRNVYAYHWWFNGLGNKKKKVGKGKGKKKKSKKDTDDEAMEDSDDGDMEAKQVDYMSDTSERWSPTPKFL